MRAPTTIRPRRRVPTGLVVGGLLTAVPLVMAIIGPLVSARPPRGPAFTLGEPFLLGTDSEGRDVVTSVLDGGLGMLSVALGAIVVCYAVAIPCGLGAALAASSPGTRVIDELLMRPLDIVLSIPSLMLLLLVASMAGPSTPVLVVTVAALLAPDAIRVLRTAALGHTRSPAMEAMTLLGEGWFRRVVLHLGRAVSPVLLTDLGLRFVGAVYLVASASFIGLTADPSGTDWAVMVDHNRAGLFLAPWGVVVPAALIVSLAVGVNLLADGRGRVRAMPATPSPRSTRTEVTG